MEQKILFMGGLNEGIIKELTSSTNKPVTWFICSLIHVKKCVQTFYIVDHKCTTVDLEIDIKFIITDAHSLAGNLCKRVALA